MGMPRKKSKSPPVMSHEFVIQNHADILACIAIFIVAGLLTEVRVFITVAARHYCNSGKPCK